MFVGYFSISSGLPEPILPISEHFAQALSPLVPATHTGIWLNEHAFLAELQINQNGLNPERELPLRCSRTGTVVAFWGRLDNRGELADRLSIVGSRRDSMTDSALVLEAWHRWHDQLPDLLVGDFSLAVIDPENHRLLLARDPLGVKPLYFSARDGGLAFATSVSALKVVPGVELSRDSDWMVRYLYQGSRSLTRTAYSEIQKLTPGHALTIAEDGKPLLRRWFRWEYEEPRWITTRSTACVDAYREKLEEAIRARMDGHYPLGSENSGGMDSGAITAFLARNLESPSEQLYGLSQVTQELEPSYIIETARQSGMLHNTILTQALPHIADDETIGQILAIRGYPEEHDNGSYQFPLFHECRRLGIQTLFSGFGGDEIVTRYGAQLMWELRDHGNYYPLYQLFTGNHITRFLRMAKFMLSGSAPPEYEEGFYQANMRRWPHFPIREEVAAEKGLFNSYIEMTRHEAPYRTINDAIVDFHLTKAPFIANRLENATLAAAAWGVDYQFPLLDVRLIRQYLSTPSIEKMGPDRIGRYLHRRAIDGIVPDRVAWKRSKNMGLAGYVHQMNTEGIMKLADMAKWHEANLHPELEEFVDRGKFRKQIAVASRGDADDYFTDAFLDFVSAIRWLNAWLHDGDLPG